MPTLSPIQWAAIAGAVLLIGWPMVSKLFAGLVPKIRGWFASGGGEDRPPAHDVLDDVVCLRSHMLDEPAALKAIDEVILPAAVRIASKAE